MSNSLAIAAVTETLRQLLDRCINATPADDPGTDPELAGTSVTTRPLDKARGSATGNQVNLFLYQTSVNAAWRNQTMPRQVRSGENALPPLPLDLNYILTAYGSDDEGEAVLAHRLLGRAMGVLHDATTLNRPDVQAALAGNDLYEQIELVRVVPHPLSTEEIARLWAAFQTPYRISASYQVSVVLIDSGRPVVAPLPVLTRGKDDHGPFVAAAPPPSLTTASGIWNLSIQPPPGAPPLTRAVLAPGSQPLSRLGDSLVITAANLPDSGVTLRFTHSQLPDPVELDLQAGDRPGQWKVDLPAPAALDAAGNPARFTWAAGFYTLNLVVRQTDTPVVLSNALPLMVAPAITFARQPAGGDIKLSVTCDPRLTTEQGHRAYLLFGSLQLTAQTINTPADKTQPTTLTFLVPASTLASGTYTVRLRVDGVDSLPFAAPATPPRPTALMFDPQQQVILP